MSGNKMQAQELLELAVLIGRESNPTESNAFVTARTLKAIIRIARRLHALDERACNEEMPENYDDKLEEALKRCCNALGTGFGFIRNHDPRGYAVLLTTPNKVTTDWGNRGIGVW